MKKIFTLLFIFICSIVHAQTIVEFNFNSVPPDASTSTGSITPSTGSGTITTIGGVVGSFASGSGSTDPAATDNTAFSTTTYPAATAGNKTAGIEIAVNTTGVNGINLKFDLRLSNTAANTYTIQYSTDGTTFTDFATLVPPVNGTTITFNNNNSYNFASIPALNNNPNVKFRVVATFASGGSTYVGNNSTYGTTGTARFDMVNVSSGAVVPVTISSFTGSYINKTSLLRWTADNEINITKYTVERSTDGGNFKEIGFVNATGSREYTFTDATAKTPINLYRLKISGPGELKYTGVVKVLSNVFGSNVNVYPSPAVNYVNAEFTCQNKDVATLRMTDASGRIVMQNNIPVQQGYNNLSIDVKGLNKGMYVLKITIAGKVTSSVFNKF